MRACRWLLLLLLLLASGCGTPDRPPAMREEPEQPCDPTVMALTEGPAAPTAPPPAPTAPAPSPAPTAPEVPALAPTGMPYEQHVATAVALATAQPFPTAAAAVVQPGRPASARAARGGLSLTVELPGDRLLAGEAAQVRLTLRNDGDAPLFIAGDGREAGWVRLQDARGIEPAAWPWQPANWPGGAYLARLEPGQAISVVRTAQTPPEDAAPDQAYQLWGATRFARGVPGLEGPDNIWLHLEAGPIPLGLQPPGPQQRLQAVLTTDRRGWRIQATAPDGRPIGDAWGVLEIVSSSGGGSIRPLAPGDGRWSDVWDEHLRPADATIYARGWVAAPGFATAAFTATVGSPPPAPTALAQRFGGAAVLCRRAFADPAAAQAALRLLVARLPGARLERGEAAIRSETAPGLLTITSLYLLPDGTPLTLIQRISAAPQGWSERGEPTFDPEAQPVAVGDAPGRLIQRYGQWVLEWDGRGVAYELRAPIGALPAAELARMAAQVAAAP